ARCRACAGARRPGRARPVRHAAARADPRGRPRRRRPRAEGGSRSRRGCCRELAGQAPVTDSDVRRPWATRTGRTVEDEQVMEVRALLGAPAVEVGTVDPDAALVAAAREEPQAFLALYERYFDRVLGYVRLRIRDESACEDVVSTVFTTALAQLRRFR